MKRREFIALGTATAAGLFLPNATLAAPLTYEPGLVKARQDAGEVIFLDFKASWCSTCRAQERVIKQLKSQNPDYEAKITFIDIDWDDYGNSQLVKSMNIPRRSTLVALNGKSELGRIVAQTDAGLIKALMDQALSAATNS